MTEVQKYRSQLRGYALRVVVGLYILVITPMIYKYFRASSLGGDAQVIVAHITSSRPAGRKESRGASTYEYVVDGRNYSGSAELELPVGSELKVYYSPNAPSNSSMVEPGQARENHLTGIVALTFAYGFMAILAVALMSVVSPPAGTTTADPEGVGISRTQ